MSDPNSQSFGDYGLPRGSHPTRRVMQDVEFQQRDVSGPSSSYWTDPKPQIITAPNVAYYVFTGIIPNGLILKPRAEKPEASTMNSPFWPSILNPRSPTSDVFSNLPSSSRMRWNTLGMARASTYVFIQNVGETSQKCK